VPVEDPAAAPAAEVEGASVVADEQPTDGTGAAAPAAKATRSGRSFLTTVAMIGAAGAALLALVLGVGGFVVVRRRRTA
jgi:hypothetical protein